MTNSSLTSRVDAAPALDTSDVVKVGSESCTLSPTPPAPNAPVLGPLATADGVAAKPTAAFVTPGSATPSSFRTMVSPMANVFVISISYDAAAPAEVPGWSAGEDVRASLEIAPSAAAVPAVAAITVAVI